MYLELMWKIPSARARQSDAVLALAEKRRYLVQQSPMTEAGIRAGLDKDLFVALGDQLGNGGWSVRVQYKPLIRFIWLGALIMALGGLIAITDRRYRSAAREKSAAGAVAQEAAA